MKLSVFIKKSGFTWQEFADKAAVSRQTIWLLMNKKHTPRVQTIDRINKASDGQVTLEDLRTQHG